MVLPLFFWIVDVLEGTLVNSNEPSQEIHVHRPRFSTSWKIHPDRGQTDIKPSVPILLLEFCYMCVTPVPKTVTFKMKSQNTGNTHKKKTEVI